MDKYKAIEQAYNNGYAKGFEDGQKAEQDIRTDNLEELRKAFAELAEAGRQAAEALAEAVAEIVEPTRPDLPRPPKNQGPANKANYTTSRPPRRARSSCYKRQR